MSVFRVHKTENYTVMSNYHLRDKNLTLKTKGLMSVMLSLPEDWDYNAKGLSTLSVDGEDAVKSALKELEEHKYLKRTPIREKGVIKDWQYDIYENPETLENTASEPEVEKPLVVEPLMAKQSQINTNKINTKEINSNSTIVELEPAKPARRVLIETKSVNTTKETSKKKNLYEKCVDEIDKFTEDTEIRERLKEYLPIRLARKEIPLNLPTFKGMLKRLVRVATTRDEQLSSIQQSIDRQYPTFYEPHKYKNDKTQDKSVFSEFGQVKSVKSNEEIVNVQF